MSTDNLTVQIPSDTTGPQENPHQTSSQVASHAAEGSAPQAERAFGNGEFSSVEALEEAYSALKLRVSQQDEQSTLPPPSNDKTSSEAAPERASADSTLESKGLSLTTYEQEWNQNGVLSEGSYTALEKAGIARAMVDNYIAGQSALMQSFVGEVHQLAGGTEAYSAMTEWAKSAMTEQEASAYNTIMNKGDKESIKLAVTGLVSRYRDVEGHTPQLVGGKASAGAGARDAFESTAQVTAAMRDPRYRKDAAYTRSVEEKMRRSNVFG